MSLCCTDWRGNERRRKNLNEKRNNESNLLFKRKANPCKTKEVRGKNKIKLKYN
jgi:hypothetical protein